jgi:type 1 glutamine amidotransferase
MRFIRLTAFSCVVFVFNAPFSLWAAQPDAKSSTDAQVLNDNASMQSSVERKRPKLALIISEFEYRTFDTIPAYAKQHLSSDFQIKSAVNSDEHCQDLPEIEILRNADVAIISMWRRTLPPEQLAVLRDYIDAGKPIVGIRAASHAFITRDGSTPQGRESWPKFDRDVLGCHYDGHHGNYAKEGHPPTTVWAIPQKPSSPLLAGISAGEFIAPSWLYKVEPLSEGAEPLMMGRVADRQPHQPVAWTYRTKANGRVFYTSLGSPEDFELPQFQRLLRNAVYWAASLPIPSE